MILFLIGIFVGFTIGFIVCAIWSGRNKADFSHEKVIDLAVEKERKIIKILHEKGQ